MGRAASALPISVITVDLPVLWHFRISHFNEKARWALDWKRVPHVRRAVLPVGGSSVTRSSIESVRQATTSVAP